MNCRGSRARGGRWGLDTTSPSPQQGGPEGRVKFTNRKTEVDFLHMWAGGFLRGRGTAPSPPSLLCISVSISLSGRKQIPSIQEQPVDRRPGHVGQRGGPSGPWHPQVPAPSRERPCLGLVGAPSLSSGPHPTARATDTPPPPRLRSRPGCRVLSPPSHLLLLLRQPRRSALAGACLSRGV